MGMSSTPKRISIESHEDMDIKKAVTGEKGEPTVDKVAAIVEKVAPAEEKICARSLFKERNNDLHDVSKNYKSPRKIMGRKPAEVFRTDFITAMKLPEYQQLSAGEYVTLSDAWRQEWEKGVQVPVNPDKMPKPVVRKRNKLCKQGRPFVLPVERMKFEKKVYIASFDRSTTTCDYDLDDVDVHWLKSITSLRTMKKATSVDELTMERAITWFERQCFDKMAHEVVTKEGLSIEYDESTTCNVCLSPDAEDGNEIIFCDACNMCAHQHCYGVLDIPEGNWLCNPCSRGNLSPPCCLCPNKGGAMKRMKDSLEWIHVICAWWVPEVKIEDVRYIERITKDKIPTNRWNLNCSICWEKTGACIQCSVKRCVRAYHITCAVKEGLEMKTVVDPEKDDVQHISFCSKHCTPVPPEVSPHMNRSGEEVESNRLTELRKLESEFYSLVSVNKASHELRLSREVTRRMLSYWTMKRRDNENTALIPLTLEQQEKLSGKQGVVLLNQQKSLEMERFLHLRQDLERLRNLCYMIVRREKMRKELHRSSIDIFLKQNDILLDKNEDLSGNNIDFIRHRTTKFAKFSEYYQTEKQYESQHGVKLRTYEDSGEEEGDLFNSSVIEHINHEDFNRPSSTTSESKKSQKTRKSNTATSHKSNSASQSVNDSQKDNTGETINSIVGTEVEGNNVSNIGNVGNEVVTDGVEKSKKNNDKKTDPERNIFELLVPKTEECSDCNSDAGEWCAPSSNTPTIDTCSMTDKISIIDKTSTTHTPPKKNKPRKHKPTRHKHSTKDKYSVKDKTQNVTLCNYFAILPKENLLKMGLSQDKDIGRDLDSNTSKENIDSNATNISEEKLNNKMSLNSTRLHSPIDVEENAFERFNKFLDSPVHENGFSTSPEEPKPTGLAPIPNNCINLNTPPGLKRKKKRLRNLRRCENQVRRNSPRLNPIKIEIDITEDDDVASSIICGTTVAGDAVIVIAPTTASTAISTTTTTSTTVSINTTETRTTISTTTTTSTATISCNSTSPCVATSNNKVLNPTCSPPSTSLGERLSKLIKETKRRRLNSAGDYHTDIKNQPPDYEEPPDYVRITRSRRTCSQVTGTA